MRTQQILCYETGVVNTADPLGGSYYVESLTKELEEEITKLMDQWKDDIAERIMDGRIMRTIIDEGAYRFQKEVETGERTVVGVNKFTIPEEVERKQMLHVIDEKAVNEHLNNVKELRSTRDTRKVVAGLENLRRMAERKEENVFPALVEAAKSYATLSEIMGAVRMAYGYDYDGFGLLQYPFA
jgi:methylmalonyl-CoA mutase N-terminal domain/subunit